MKKRINILYFIETIIYNKLYIEYYIIIYRKFLAGNGPYLDVPRSTQHYLGNWLSLIGDKSDVWRSSIHFPHAYIGIDRPHNYNLQTSIYFKYLAIFSFHKPILHSFVKFEKISFVETECVSSGRNIRFFIV